MPSIWNINGKVNTNQKKMSSKLTFEVGEKFSGKILGKGDGQDVVIRLSDGWQFLAELQDNAVLEQQVFMRFKVEGFKDGKLKLKVIKGENEGVSDSQDSLENIAKKENLSKEDLALLRNMIKHDIPLTRENIINIKSIVQFNEKISDNPNEEDDFIAKFLQSKGISEDSNEAQKIKSELKSFFTSFKGLSQKDIMLFLENNIDFTKENIDSFTKLFKGDETLKDFFSNIKKQFEVIGNDVESKIPQNKAQDSSLSQTEVKEDVASKNANTSLATKAYASNEKMQSKFSMLTLLKSMMGEKSDLVKEPIKDILTRRVNEFQPREYKKAILQLNVIKDNAFLTEIKSKLPQGAQITREAVNSALSRVFDKNISITNKEFNNVMDVLRIIDENMGDNSNNIKSGTLINQLKEIVNNRSDFFSNPGELQFIDKNLDELNVNKFLDDLNNFLANDDEITKTGVEKAISKQIGKNIEINNTEFSNIQDTIIKLSENIDHENAAKEILNNRNDIQIVKEILFNRIDKFTIDEFNALVDKSEQIKDSEITNLIEKNIQEEGSISRSDLNEILSKLLDKDISLTTKEFDKIKDSFKSMYEKENNKEVDNAINKIKNMSKDELIKTINEIMIEDSNSAEKQPVNSETMKDAGKLTKEEQDMLNPDKASESKTETSKSDGISKEKIDKIVSKILNKETHVDEKQFQEIKQIVKETLANKENPEVNKAVKAENLLKDIITNKDALSPKEAIKNNFKENITDIKDVVKDLVNSFEKNMGNNSSLLDIIKGNINDFKLLNSISNEYYYVDIPINQNGNEYPCKLIIKDKRKEGKKLDKTNVKMVVSVKTVNMGGVDGYLNIQDSILNIDIKCEKKYLKILDRDSRDLVEGLRRMGLFANVFVSEKIEDVDITTCREFFDDSKLGLLDRRV